MDIVSKINGNTCSATEFNQIPTELEALQTSSGQTSSDAILNQVSIATSRYAANNFYIDSGVADAYILTLAASMTNPVSAVVGQGYFIGMIIRFRAGNAGTGGAATVNVNGAGVKSLKEADGSTNPISIPTTKDTEWRYDGSVFKKVNSITDATQSTEGIAKLPKQIIITNNATDANNDIDFSTGNFDFSDGTGSSSISALIKRLDANWAAGTNQGGLDTGAKTNSTTYYCFAIYNPTTFVSDALFSASTTPTLPSGYTKYRKIGAIRTDGSGNIRPFYQNGNRFIFRTNILVSSATSTASRVSINMNVPSDSIVIFNANGASANASATSTIFTNLDSVDIAPSNSTGVHLKCNSSFGITGQFQIQANSSGSIGVRSSDANASAINILTEGFILTNI